MKNFSLKIFLFLLPLLCIPDLYAVRATPYPVTVTQPDGSELSVYLRGDEFFKYRTTLDGYALIKDDKGYFNYASTDANGRLTSTNIRARQINLRSRSDKRLLKQLTPNISFSRISQQQSTVRYRVAKIASETSPRKAFSLTGSPKSLVILVNFSDKSFVTSNPQTAFYNLLNQNGYSTNNGTGSARDYFSDNSMGVFNPQFDVVGPYTLPQKLDYYGKNNSDDDDTNPQQMVIDACTLASKDGIDFSQYDIDNDGYVDNIFIYYAGYNEAENAAENTIWPHRWTLSNYSTRFNGKIIFDYACTSELKGNSGSTMCGIGTFCHEFGHVLGLPDMYNTAGDYSYNTLSYWDIMDAGPYLNSGRTPPSYSSYERFYLNWLVPKIIDDAQTVTIDTLATSNNAYLITESGTHNFDGTNPNPQEFFMLENRQKNGWDAYLPGHGLMITRINYKSTTWNENTLNNDSTAMGVDIIEADGIASDRTLSSDLFPGTGYNTYNPVLRNGTDIEKPLTSITEAKGIVTIQMKGGGINPYIASTGTPTTFSTVQGTPSSSQNITVSGFGLKSSIKLGFKNDLHFQIKKESDTVWGDSITLYPTASTVYKTKIQIRYNPQAPSYNETHTDELIISADNANPISVKTSGVSSRPVYVVPPVASAATDINYSKFTSNWNDVFDATGFYITVCNYIVGDSTFTEGFANGVTAPEGWTITAKNITNSTVYSGEAAPAIEFTSSGEMVQTDDFLIPASSLSFYIRSMSGVNGKFLLEAKNDADEWMRIDSVVVTSTLKTTKSYSFDESEGFKAFRFTYYKGSGYVTLDDVTVGFSKRVEYVIKDKWVTGTSFDISNLNPNTTYFYKLKASDKSDLYENITSFSNTISVTTSPYPTVKNLITTADTQGNITVYLPSTDQTLYVYNAIGQCIRIYEPGSSIITITDLPRSQLYILKANQLKAKIAI